MALHSGTKHPLNPAVGMWWPTIAVLIGTSRLLAADGMVVTTTQLVLVAGSLVRGR